MARFTPFLPNAVSSWRTAERGTRRIGERLMEAGRTCPAEAGLMTMF